MTDRLIGLGLLECVYFMANYGLPVDEVNKIVCLGRSDWERLLKFAKDMAEPFVPGGHNDEGIAYGAKIHKLAKELEDKGKIDFLGNISPRDKPYTGYGFWTTDEDFIISKGLHCSAFSDFVELTRTGKRKSSRVIDAGWGLESITNIVYEFDRDALAAIRAKHKSGFRKAIAQFFGV